MKKMTFLSILPLLSMATLFSSQGYSADPARSPKPVQINDLADPIWSPKPVRAKDQERIRQQKRTLYPQNISRSPSPQPQRKIVLPKRQSPAHSVTKR